MEGRAPSRDVATAMTPPRKTVTKATLIGERGVALIHRRCGEMGYLFHPRRIDHGIDGDIELVDANDGAALNLVLLVQSKAHDQPFTGETEDSFHYVCDARDLDYWLEGNAPVILVFSHPTQQAAWWVHVQSAFADAGSRQTRRVVVDKRTHRFDASAATALLRLAVPASTVSSLRPPPLAEELVSNLLPVLEVPASIFLAPAAANDYAAAWALLPEPRPRSIAWILSAGELVAFADPHANGLGPLCAGPVRRIATTEWSASSTTDAQHRFSHLLSAVVEHSHPELRWHATRQHLHFRSTDDLSPRKAGRRRGASGRTVFGPHKAKSDPERVSYYHHAAVRLRFRRVGGTWFCILEPDYCFTVDGKVEASFADSLLAGIKRFERHAAVAGWTAMWAAHLQGDADLYQPPRPVRLGAPVCVPVARGIDERWWGAAPAGAMLDDEPGDGSDATSDANAAITAADVDPDDLFSLLEEPTPAERGAARPEAGVSAIGRRHGARRRQRGHPSASGGGRHAR